MLFIAILQFLSLACLSLAMDKHFKAIFKRKNKAIISLLLTCIGWLGLCLSAYSISYMPLPISISIIYVLGSLSLSILLISICYCIFTAKTQTMKKSRILN